MAEGGKYRGGEEGEAGTWDMGTWHPRPRLSASCTRSDVTQEKATQEVPPQGCPWAQGTPGADPPDGGCGQGSGLCGQLVFLPLWPFTLTAGPLSVARL